MRKISDKDQPISLKSTMWKVEPLKLTLLPVSILSVVCDTRSDQNVFYFSLMNRSAIWKLVEETASMSIVCGAINGAGQVDGDFASARFSHIGLFRLGMKDLYVVDKVVGKCKIRKLDFEKRTVSTSLTLRDEIITGLVVDKEDNLIFSTDSGIDVVKLDSQGNQTVLFTANSASSRLMLDNSCFNLYVLSEMNICRVSMDTYQTIHTYSIPNSLRITDVFLDSAETQIYGYSAPNIWSLDLRNGRESFLKLDNADHFFNPPMAKILVDRSGCLCIWNSQGGRRLRPPKLPWKFARLLWIGKWKNTSQECSIAKLPVEILREIIGGWNHAYLTNY